MHERSPKNHPLDTLLYERDMLRHCATTIEEKQRRFESSQSTADQAEYYLGIEGFLLHYRNLLGFFINKGHKETDLTIGHPERWAAWSPVDQAVCNDLKRRAQEVNNKHGLGGGDCYQKISWFLQHCTTHRHMYARSWDIEDMFADLSPVLEDFVQHFAPNAEKVRVPHLGDSNSTATITRIPILAD